MSSPLKTGDGFQGLSICTTNMEYNTNSPYTNQSTTQETIPQTDQTNWPLPGNKSFRCRSHATFTRERRLAAASGLPGKAAAEMQGRKAGGTQHGDSCGGTTMDGISWSPRPTHPFPAVTCYRSHLGVRIRSVPGRNPIFNKLTAV